MKRRVRVTMLKSRDQLISGQSYILRSDLAEELVKEGCAFHWGLDLAIKISPSEVKPIGPSETKPAFPSELKKKKRA